MARSCWLARRHAHAIWVGNSNGTNGRAGVQNSSLSKLLRWDWNLEKSIATGTHNSEPLNYLERRLAAAMRFTMRAASGSYAARLGVQVPMNAPCRYTLGLGYASLFPRSVCTG